jgi:hypothetical protein
VGSVEGFVVKLVEGFVRHVVGLVVIFVVEFVAE